MCKEIDSFKSAVDEAGGACSQGAATKGEPVELSGDCVIDWDQLIGRIVDEDIAVEIIPVCVADNRERLVTLTSAVQAGNAEDVKLYAHSIKGSAANIGARQLSEAAAELEHMAYRGDLSRAEELLEQIKAESAKLESFVSNPDWVEKAKAQPAAK
ncbi:MAG: Hpt domain-containing protein [Sedimentisphaerales bacterium]|nr:Hpt domain-containing protein [Sedimentisphaerales bacterium]